MRFKIIYGNVEAEFDANTKEEIYAAEKLFKTAAYTFREDDIKRSMSIYGIKDRTMKVDPNLREPRNFGSTTPRNPATPIDPNGPATEKQLACLRARHIDYSDGITKAEAFALIKNSNPRR